MSEQTEHDHEPEVFAAAVGAAQAVLGDVPEETVAEALRAAGEVMGEYDEAHAERLVGETLLAGFEGGALRLVLARELAAKMTLAFKTILDASPGVENYVEQEIFERETNERYLFIVCKPRGRTPHQLRREAEADRDRYRSATAWVRKLHEQYRSPWIDDYDVCSHCTRGMEQVPWPCPTVQALNQAMFPDRAAVGGGAGNPAREDQPPPTPTETGADR